MMHTMTHTSDSLMQQTEENPPCKYIYTYACHESEMELCGLELKELLGLEQGQVTAEGTFWVEVNRLIDPDRSPFISARLDVMLNGTTVEQIAEQASRIKLTDSSFKITCLKVGDPFTYEEMRSFERLVGGSIQGTAEMKAPDITFGLISIDGRWVFGRLEVPKRAWLTHKQKPQNYSTGLSSRVARALVNIAAPATATSDKGTIRLLDPCCGMGNVLIEALSMGLDVKGRDINPLAIRGARVNLKHYGYDDSVVKIADMNDLEGEYEVAVLDLPYNVCSVFPEDEKRRMLSSLRRFARRAVIVSTEPLEELLPETGWRVLDRITTRKGSFVREVWLCE